MSYILDALNKADKERQQHKPNKHAPIPNKNIKPLQISNHRFWFVFLALMVPVAMTWFGFHQQKTPTPTVQNIQASPPKSKNTLVVPSKPVWTKPKPETQTKLTNTKIPRIMALDSTLRDQLPPIHISAHVYSNNAKKCMVIINGKVLHEGAYIAKELILEKVLVNTIQLNFNGTTFTMNIKEQWTAY